MTRTPGRGGIAWTSLHAYASIIDTLGARQKAVLISLTEYVKTFDRAPTGAELEAHSGIRGAWKRCSELVKANVVHEGAARKCTITGHLAKVWLLGPGDDQGQGSLF